MGSKVLTAKKQLGALMMYERKLKRLIFSILAVIFALSLIALVPPSEAKTIKVDINSPVSTGDGTSWAKAIKSINLAMMQATMGDEIQVAQGNYFERVNVKAGVTLLGGFTRTGNERVRTDPSNVFTTEINAEGKGTAVTMASNTRVGGFRITKGKNSSGNGGGIYCQGQNIIIINNRLCFNEASRGGGIAFDVEGTKAIIINNRIDNNKALNYGGGIAAISSSGTIAFNRISANTAQKGAGALYCQGGNPLIAHNLITGNTASEDGGGAIIFESYAQPYMRNNIVNGNSAKTFGGGVYCRQGAIPSIINNTFYMNKSTDSLYYGIYSDASSLPYLRNLIIQNTGNPVVKGDKQVSAIPYSLLISYLNEADPSFVSPIGGDFHLKPGSPAIDMGDPAIEYNDRDGTRNDQGAYGGPLMGSIGVFYKGITRVASFDGEVPCTFEITLKSILTSEGLEIRIAETDELITIIDGGSGLVSWEIDGQEGPVDPRHISLNQGENLFTITIYDVLGATFEEQIAIIAGNRKAPVPKIAVLPDIIGECSVKIAYDQYPIAIDECMGEIKGVTSSPLNYNQKGEYLITWKFANNIGLIATQEQRVIVADTTAPEPANPTLPVITGECSSTLVISTRPTALDNCDGLITGTLMQTQPLIYTAVGTYSITWKYEDTSGNTKTQDQQIVIKDTKAPLPSMATLTALNGTVGVPVVISKIPTAKDQCAGTINGKLVESTPLIYNTPGKYTITWRYTDSNGNSTSQKQTVNIESPPPVVPSDTAPPTVNAGADKILAEGNKVNLTAVANDNVTAQNKLVFAWYEGTTKIGSSAALSKAFKRGVHELRVEVTDEAGNIGTDTVKVTVIFGWWGQPILPTWQSWQTAAPTWQSWQITLPTWPSQVRWPTVGTSTWPYYK
ncbi:MAG: hypothetical protein ACMUJM_19845 [bacterium]